MCSKDLKCIAQNGISDVNQYVWQMMNFELQTLEWKLNSIASGIHNRFWPVSLLKMLSIFTFSSTNSRTGLCKCSVEWINSQNLWINIGRECDLSDDDNNNNKPTQNAFGSMIKIHKQWIQIERVNNRQKGHEAHWNANRQLNRNHIFPQPNDSGQREQNHLFHVIC